MIKKLTKKFFVISISALFVVELLMAALINGLNFVYTVDQADETIAAIIENNGKLPEKWKNYLNKKSFEHEKKPYDREMIYITRYFTANVDSSGKTVRLDTSNISSVSSDEAIEYAEKVYNTGVEHGFIDGFDFRYAVSPSPDGTKLIVIYDFSRQSSANIRVIKISLIIAAVLLLFFSVMIFAFSKRAVRPVIQNMDKQAQFITDAGHELKTPLAIIRADAEVLEMTGGSEWTKSILNQTDRLSELVADMLTLAKAQESQRIHFYKLDLSALAKKAAEDIKPLCSSANKPIKTEIEDGLICLGNKKAILRAVSLLLENAVKYGSDGREIILGLKRNGRHHARLWVENYCDEMPDCDPKLLFERFYRADSSRTRETGGSGIGLSTVKAIADSHKAKAGCEINGDVITFSLKFKLRKMNGSGEV